MAETPRNADVIDSQIAVRERIRKLETTHQSRVFVPRKWHPSKDEFDAITMHNYLAGWNIPSQVFTAGTYASNFGVAQQTAQYLWERELMEGYGIFDALPDGTPVELFGTFPEGGGGGVGLAVEWYQFRTGIGIYPHPSLLIQRGHEWQIMGRFDTPGSVPQSSMSKIAHVYPPHGNAAQLFAAGASLHNNQVVIQPGYSGKFWHDDGSWDYDTSIGWHLYPNAFFTGDRNTVWFDGGDFPHDCGDPTGADMSYSPALYPGQPFYFEQEGISCPNRPGETGVSGAGVGIYFRVGLPFDDFFFDSPPYPFSGQSMGGGATYYGLPTGPFASPTAPTYDQLRARIVAALESGEYPLIEYWYARRLPYTEPKTSKHWAYVHLIMPWRGRVQYKIDAGRCRLRGVATYTTQLDGSIMMLLPPSVQHVVPNISLGGIVQVQLGDTSGPKVPFALNLRKNNGQVYFAPVGDAAFLERVSGHTTIYEDGEPTDKPPWRTIYFDGASFPVDLNY